MDLLVLVVVIALVGFLIVTITTHVPMPPGWARALQVLALVVLVLYLISRFLPLPNVLPR